MKTVRVLVLTLVIVVSFSLSLIGQTYFDQIGLPEFSAPQPVEAGFINLSNGNLHLEIPISTVELRGGRKLISKLVYDSLM